MPFSWCPMTLENKQCYSTRIKPAQCSCFTGMCIYLMFTKLKFLYLFRFYNLYNLYDNGWISLTVCLFHFFILFRLLTTQFNYYNCVEIVDLIYKKKNWKNQVKTHTCSLSWSIFTIYAISFQRWGGFLRNFAGVLRSYSRSDLQNTLKKSSENLYL